MFVKKIIVPILTVLLACGGLAVNIFAAGVTKTVKVAQPQTNIVGDISVVQEVESSDSITKVMKGEKLPAMVAMEIDKNLNVLGGDGEKITTVQEAIAACNYQVIQVFEVTDKDTVDSLATFLQTENYYDVCVMSKDASLVKYARASMPAIRGAIDFTDTYKNIDKLSNAQLVDIRKETMKNNGYIAILPAQVCEKEAVQHLYDGRIPVWAKLSEKASVKEQYQVVLSGVSGIISNQSEEILEIVCDKLESDTLTRASLNVGHKGMPIKALENTIESGREAVKAGADALEIDVYMTKDNEIVIMHDYKTGKTCDKDLVIADSTLAELKELWVVRNEDGTGTDFAPCRIATLEEFFKEFQNTEVRFFIEFKGGGEEIVKEVRDLVNEYQMYDRCNTIAFDAGVMADIRKLWPEMPISYLTYTMPIDETNADASFAAVMEEIGKYNATFSPSISTQGSITGSRAALIRGVMINGWTYQKQSTYLVSYMNGASSITGDDASAMAQYPVSLTVKNLQDGLTVKKGTSIALDVEELLYKGKNVIDSGLDCLVLEGDGVVIMNGNQLTFNKTGEITFVLEYQHPITTINEPTLYSEPITVTVLAADEDTDDTTSGDDKNQDSNTKEETGEDQEEKGHIGTGDRMFNAMVIFVITAALSATAVVLVVRKRKMY